MRHHRRRRRLSYYNCTATAKCCRASNANVAPRRRRRRRRERIYNKKKSNSSEFSSRRRVPHMPRSLHGDHQLRRVELPGVSRLLQGQRAPLGRRAGQVHRRPCWRVSNKHGDEAAVRALSPRQVLAPGHASRKAQATASRCSLGRGWCEECEGEGGSGGVGGGRGASQPLWWQPRWQRGRAGALRRVQDAASTGRRLQRAHQVQPRVFGVSRLLHLLASEARPLACRISVPQRSQVRPDGRQAHALQPLPLRALRTSLQHDRR